MKDIILQLAGAFFGSLGFSILYNIKKDKLFYAAFGGFLVWAIYLGLDPLTKSDAVRYLIATFFVTFYAELMARKKKTPATLFLVPATIPLIPGGSLYYTMLALTQGNREVFYERGMYTLRLAGAIACGILLAMTVWRVVALLTRLEYMQKR